MKDIKSIQIKALVLLVVFSLNILVGFACAVGIDMGYNSQHHHDEKAVAKNSTQHHDEMINHHDDSEDCPNNCCKDKVTKITQADKLVPESYKTELNPIFFATFISAFYQSNILFLYLTNKADKHFVRSTPPTIPDIRIAIQSFLI